MDQEYSVSISLGRHGKDLVVLLADTSEPGLHLVNGQSPAIAPDQSEDTGPEERVVALRFVCVGDSHEHGDGERGREDRPPSTRLPERYPAPRCTSKAFPGGGATP